MICINWAISLMKSSNTTSKPKQKYFQFFNVWQILKNINLKKWKVWKLKIEKIKPKCFLLKSYNLWWDYGWYSPYYDFWSLFSILESFLNYSVFLFNLKSIFVRKKENEERRKKREGVYPLQSGFPVTLWE